MAFPAYKTGSPGWEKVVGTTKRARLGEDMYIYPGRWFRYGLAGEAATRPLLQTSITAVDDHDLDLVTAVAAIGATTVTVTLGATASLLNEYTDGFLIVNDLIGEGFNYLIKNHPAAAASASLVITLDEPDGIVVALDATSQTGLVHALGFDFVVHPTTQSAPPLGAACVNVANNEFAWLQYRGMGVARVDATAPGAGLPCMPSNATAGNLELFDMAGTYNAWPVASMSDAVSVSTEHASVLWMM